MADSILTKRAISEGMKALCQTKSFDKITISDLTGACGLNRQTFYYHFEDKFELLNWTYYHDAFQYLVEGITLDNWDDHLKTLLVIMKRDKIFYSNTIKCQPDFFTNYLFETTQTLFYEAMCKLDVSEQLPDADKRFHARFYAYGCCGVVTEWVRNGMKQTPEELSSQLRRLARDSERFASQLYENPPSMPPPAEREKSMGMKRAAHPLKLNGIRK